MNFAELIFRKEVTLQTHHEYSTLKRRENDRFHVDSKWNTRGVFVGRLLLMCVTFCQNSFLPHDFLHPGEIKTEKMNEWGMKERFETNILTVSSFQMISINFPVLFANINQSIKIMFKKLTKDVHEKLKIILEF